MDISPATNAMIESTGRFYSLAVFFRNERANNSLAELDSVPNTSLPFPSYALLHLVSHWVEATLLQHIYAFVEFICLPWQQSESAETR